MAVNDDKIQAIFDALVDAKIITINDAYTGDQIPEIIRGIQQGTDTSDATATSAQLLEGWTAYGKNGKINGAMPDNSEDKPIMSLSWNQNVLTITPQIPRSGYWPSKNYQSFTETIAINNGGTYTPGTRNVTLGAFGSRVFYAGSMNMAGDANLIPANIKSGVSIFGVNGTYSGASSWATIQLRKQNGFTCNYINSAGAITLLDAYYNSSLLVTKGMFLLEANSTPYYTGNVSLFGNMVLSSGGRLYVFNVTGECTIQTNV